MNGYKGILAKRRQEMLQTFPMRLEQVATKYGKWILNCPTNTISFGVTLDNPVPARKDEDREDAYLRARDISAFGSMLFSRCVSGTRVMPRAQSKTMGEFVGFGSSVVGIRPCIHDGSMCRWIDKTLQEKHDNKQPNSFYSKRVSLSQHAVA
ncbi:Sep (O-phosphoserine) tRNA Sec (Selenocysteine) tRNA synthase [Seminavis robusta]|uniref:Sep (O-phosphoserine) tRNA Sec (Selenocysteine) tRNA synthase n=1 Tax=Seminavis robusta TaxID=568900 RepID=A0A9N8EGP7_9STRA|nr:Sep (O-phosphoserine) tRNA Sec (Selenocysteine) tRNA synthase [Seminavis robusta]|eukprot:Sro1055_g236020.1 Sep (O-phosphoserine) tRNA Sec (Selenocysteine) tRNA synthase (152) ;mRNA; f:3664-4119